MSVVVVQGAASADDVPGIARISDRVELRFAPDHDALVRALPGADILFGWNFRGQGLAGAWDHADSLKWIQWAGAGVDAVLFPELVASSITLTNMRGMFDRAMAEWAAGYILVYAKNIDSNMHQQMQKVWAPTLTTRIIDSRVLVVGTGSIGQECGRVLQALGMKVDGVGRKARDGGDAFGAIHGVDTLHEHLGDADYVVLVTPLTDATRNLFSTAEFAAMKSTAIFLNIGRGQLVDEPALIDALENNTIAGAALDVFREEPLPPTSPFWTAPNCIVSPHHSGDYDGHMADMVDVFIDNLDRWEKNQPLLNIIDKAAGFSAS